MNIDYKPIDHAPLAFLATRHFNEKPFPDSSPDMKRSRWYTYSGITNSEILVFCQYDRDLRVPSDLWHCAIASQADFSDKCSGSKALRESFDLRCFLVFDERFDESYDRFRNDRPQSVISQEGSRQFC